MKALGNIRTFCSYVVLTLCLCSACKAESIVDRDTILQISLTDKVKDGETPKLVIVNYKVLVALPEEASIIHIAMIQNKLRVENNRVTRAQEDVLNANAIGLISHFPPARKGATGEVRLAIPLSAQKAVDQYFLVFRMLPVHPKGRLVKSRLEVVSVDLE